ncbi:cupin domain-containing protein [filamentous cyanobacterium LEGE 11480]|uniref:Cupin domain-containing protein n=1 Tax=Romeriopsis navalis LEGE 11480 TaxID=2777977 RepID=A0A928VNP3_9CYAN|nr:cupin domain-containing protein [Romeriopsis navalis]MBE9029324.1 cupin domain-containing protein [Romeriopsis navalis LEGE 11480]
MQELLRKNKMRPLKNHRWLGLTLVMVLSVIVAASTAKAPVTLAHAHKSKTAEQIEPEKIKIVPQRERDKAQELKVKGPTKTLGITSLTNLGAVDLSGEFKSLDGYTLRAREIVVAPGGQVAVHQHNSRPGIAYIIEGEMVEYRNDQDDPIVRKAGSVAFERTGVVHWWKNQSSKPARALVVDIVPKQK